MAKPERTIQEQIALLQSRNMTFRNIVNAPHFLANISYYRLKGYWWEMQDDKINHHFANGSYFEDVIDIYNFDRNFRLIVFNAIERIEIALRTKLIYQLSLNYGPYWYLNPGIFQDPKRFASFLSKINIDMSNSSEEFIIKHFENHPDELPESWKSLEVLTLGTLSKLYSNLKHQLPEKNIIAKEFGINNQKYLASWLLTITVIRNIIAHHGRLWNRVIINKYDWPPSSPESLLSYIPNNYQRRKIFPILSAIIYMNNKISPGHHIKQELLNLFSQFSAIQLNRMGFPANWQQEPVWQ
ncbi:Abi family protein [Pseudopedobacter beijingensis]|uniref:Abi family protein n=1 Tax=Pseudopedobacter beijingensis TaxID=1207056 RepID=A0ABW4IHP9_9SPHI